VRYLICNSAINLSRAVVGFGFKGPNNKAKFLVIRIIESDKTKRIEFNQDLYKPLKRLRARSVIVLVVAII
jgi:hypothetical protein